MVCGVKAGENLGGIKTSGFGQSARNDFEGLGILANSVLGQTGGLISEVGDPLNELNLGGSSTRNKTGVLCDSLDNVDTVIDGALNIIQMVLSSTTEHNGGSACHSVGILLTENGDSVTSNFSGLDNIDLTHLIRHGYSETGQRSGTNNPAQATKLELGENLDHQNVEAVEVVKGQVANGGTSNDHTQTRIIQFLNGSPTRSSSPFV